MQEAFGLERAKKYIHSIHASFRAFRAECSAIALRVYMCTRLLASNLVLASELVIDLGEIISAWVQGINSTIWRIAVLQVSLLAEVAHLLLC